jgi:hypothetical protein
MVAGGSRGVQRAREDDDFEPMAAAPPQRRRVIDAEEASDDEDEADKENMFSFNLADFMGGVDESLFADAAQLVAEGGTGEEEVEYSLFKVAMYREEGAGPFDAASAGATLKELLGGSAIPMQTIGEDTAPFLSRSAISSRHRPLSSHTDGGGGLQLFGSVMHVPRGCGHFGHQPGLLPPMPANAALPA